jgi:hypothetical protein
MRKRSQPSQGDFFTRIALQREPWYNSLKFSGMQMKLISGEGYIVVKNLSRSSNSGATQYFYVDQ